MNNYKKLEIWKESIELVTGIYLVTKKFPKEELFALTSQIKRSSVSIPSNIAEGAGRNGNKEFIQFLGIARGSCCELETQLLIAQRLGYIASNEIEMLAIRINKISGMIINLIKKLS